VTCAHLICSGDMYWLVPMGCPVAVSLVTSVRRIAAIPKSSTLTVPSSATMTLSGLRSRWTTGTAWAWDRTVLICAAMAAAHATGSGSAGSTKARSEMPSTSSITRYRRSYEWSRTASYTWGTPWCRMRAVTRASRRFSPSKTGHLVKAIAVLQNYQTA
jgi:hypothetical protein